MSAPRHERGRLQELADEASLFLEGRDALDIVGWAAEEFGDKLCVTSSMADAVVAHLVSRVRPGVDVIFLDTGYHFAETIGTRDAVAATLPVNVINIRPGRTVAEQDADYGPRLFERDPDRCCAMRKVAPLRYATQQYHAWVSGLRRDEGASRRHIGVVEWDDDRNLVKVNPIAAWTQADVDAYIQAHGVLVNPLLDDGYASIGCAPCTRRLVEGESGRDGRWAGRAKTECGLHA